MRLIELSEMMGHIKREELKCIMSFIDKACTEELAAIIEEIRCRHDNLLVFNLEIKSLDKVESVSINGDAIQLNLESSEGF